MDTSTIVPALATGPARVFSPDDRIPPVADHLGKPWPYGSVWYGQTRTWVWDGEDWIR